MSADVAGGAAPHQLDGNISSGLGNTRHDPQRAHPPPPTWSAFPRSRSISTPEEACPWKVMVGEEDEVGCEGVEAGGKGGMFDSAGGKS